MSATGRGRGSRTSGDGGGNSARPLSAFVFPREPLRLGVLDPLKQRIARQKANTEALRAKCGACKASGVPLSACDACDAVRYRDCSRDFQRADWPAHQLACKTLATDREILVGRGIP